MATLGVNGLYSESSTLLGPYYREFAEWSLSEYSRRTQNTARCIHSPLRGRQISPFPILRETLTCLNQTGKGFLLEFGASAHSLFPSSTAVLPPAPALALCQYACLGINLDHHRPWQRTQASLRSATSSTPRSYNRASAWKGKQMTNFS